MPHGFRLCSPCEISACQSCADFPLSGASAAMVAGRSGSTAGSFRSLEPGFDEEHLAGFDPHERDTPVRIAYERISRVLG